MEIGSEATPADYLDTLLQLTAELGRVLAPHGSICVELGDIYAGSGGAGGDYGPDGWRAGQPSADGSMKHERVHKVDGWGPFRDEFAGRKMIGGPGWPLDKSLTGIPTLYAWSLAYGRNLLTGQPSPAGQWRIRNLVAWVRPNPPVGALGDKFRPATSYLTIATRARDRWFDLDAVRTPHKTEPTRYTGNGYTKGHPEGIEGNEAMPGNPAGSPPLDWWNIPPRGYDGSHYAVYPPELCERPIEAMCPRRVCTTCGTPSRRVVDSRPFEERGGQRGGIHHGNDGGQKLNGSTRFHTTATTTGWSTCGCPGADSIRLDGYHTGLGWRPGHVLDPFAGTGTTLMVANGHGRDATGIDLDDRNAHLARERLGMFLDIHQPTTEAS